MKYETVTSNGSKVMTYVKFSDTSTQENVQHA